MQEVVSRDGWASGNNLALLTTDNAGITAYCRVYAWDYTGNARGAKFNCTYTAGAPSAAGNRFRNTRLRNFRCSPEG